MPEPTPLPPSQSSGKILGMSKGVAIAVGILALVLIYIVIKRHSSQSPSSSPDSGQTAASIGGTPADNSLQYSSDQTNDAALIDALNQQSASLAELEANLTGLTSGGTIPIVHGGIGPGGGNQHTIVPTRGGGPS